MGRGREGSEARRQIRQSGSWVIEVTIHVDRYIHTSMTAPKVEGSSNPWPMAIHTRRTSRHKRLGRCQPCALYLWGDGKAWAIL